jgi:hypothetical protein
MPPYALNGHLQLWAVTLTYLEGSEVTNLYLFKVPDSLIPNRADDVGLQTAVRETIKQSRDEWLSFVKWGLDLPVAIDQYLEDFPLPQEPFDQFETKLGVFVYRVTANKL